MTPEQERALAYIARLSRRLEGPLREAVRRAARTLPTQGARGRLAAFLARGDVQGAVDYLSDHPDVVAAWAQVRGTYVASVAQAAQSATTQLVTVLRINVTAPVLNETMIQAVNRWTDTSFRAIRAEVREGLRASVANALESGAGPRQAARRITDEVARSGLTAYDRRLVQSFREQLDADPARALRRTLRDKRYDKSVTRGVLTAEQRAKMIEAYERKLSAWRAQTFARTSAMQAANDGQRAAWAEAVASGSVRADEVRRYWIVSDDERMCTVCGPVPTMNPNGVGLDDLFETPVGRIIGPVLHPNCRCTTWTRVERRAFAPAPTPGIFRARGP